MDRIISLLAAFVGLIALGAAVLISSRAETESHRLMGEIAGLREMLSAASQPAPAAATPVQHDEVAASAVAALEARIATLEDKSRKQADALASAEAALAARPPAADQAATEVAAATPTVTATPAALAEDGPTTECIPLGTRFMGQAGDSFPICKTHAVVNVAAVSDGIAVIDGAGSVAVGGVQPLTIKGCTVTVFSADSSGYAEMRVSCV